MTEYTKVKPDLDFIRSIRGLGGDSLKKCFQCATCSVVCKLSPDDAPFPRKEMFWTQWGMSDRLAGDCHVWLCHHCEDCTVHCPRGVRPGDVLAGIRAWSIQYFAFPRVLGRTASDSRFIPIYLAAGAVVLWAVAAYFGGMGVSAEKIHYDRFVPHLALYLLFGGGFGLMGLSMVLSGRRFWRALSAGTPPPPAGASTRKSVLGAVKEVLFHSRFRFCVEARARSVSHLLVFYGFAGLFVVTSVVAPLAWMGLYPLSLWHPLKILGNVSGVALCVGIVWMMVDRVRQDRGRDSVLFDWFFLILLLILGATGMALMVLRLITEPDPVPAGYAALAYGLYFVHLVAVFEVILLLPFTKFAHMVYRFLAMVHAARAGIPVGGGRADEPPRKGAGSS